MDQRTERSDVFRVSAPLNYDSDCQKLVREHLGAAMKNSHLTVPSLDALAMLAPVAEKRHLVMGLVCPEKVS